ncbi:MAG TPA: glycosyltransferase 87 family protein [Thermoanaerobaculia bacterium]|nr:glycosyltransferase 87 family protein [Thermoanaerobaculia bacterium]
MKRAAVPVALILALAAAAIPWRLGNDAAGIDFFQFWAGAELENLYSAETRQGEYAPFVEQAFARDQSHDLLVAARARTEFDFFSTPFLYATFRLLPDGYDDALLAYRVVSLAALIGGVLLLARAAGLSWMLAALVLAFVLSLFQAVKSDVRVVNVNFIQLFAIALGTWLAASREKWRSIGAGAVFALAAMWKPTVALVLPLLGVRWLCHRFQTARSAASPHAKAAAEPPHSTLAIGAVIGVAIALAVSGSFDHWLEWLAHVRSVDEIRSLNLGNVAPVLPLVNRFGSRAALFVAALLIAITAIVLLKRKQRDDDTALLVGIALLIYLLSSTLVWLHYLVLALPAGIVLLRTDRVLAALALTLAGLDVWLFLGVTWETTQALVLWLGLALLFAGSLWRLARPRLR